MYFCIILGVLYNNYVSAKKDGVSAWGQCEVECDNEDIKRTWNSTCRIEQGLTAQPEHIQWPFTRGLFDRIALIYATKLKELEIISLAARWDYLDLKMAYTLLQGLVDTDINKLNIMINSKNTRGGGTTIVANRARTT